MDILDEIDWSDFSVLPLSDVNQIERTAVSVLYENTEFKTNSGFPFYIKTDSLTEEQINLHLEWASMVMNGDEFANDVLVHSPSVLFKRSQMGRLVNGVEEAKTRAVMGVPMFTKLAGGAFWYAVYERMRNCSRYQSYHGNHALHDVVNRAIDADICVSLDFESYDTTVTHIFERLYDALIVKLGVDSRVRNILTWEKKYYFHSPLITPVGVMFGRHGLFSGCIGTSFGGSLCNAIAMRYAELRAKQERRDRHISFVSHCTMGDDTILGINTQNGEIELDELIDYIEETGLKCTRDKDKQWWCDRETPADERGVVFLSRYWHNDARQPEFSLIRALGNILWGEELTYEEQIISALGKSPRDFGNESVVGPIHMRIISSLTNVEYHPCRQQFVRYIMMGSPHKLCPMMWMGKESLLKSYGAHCDYADVQLNGMAALGVAHEIIGYYDRLLKRGEAEIPTRDGGWDMRTLKELAQAADDKHKEAKVGPTEQNASKGEILEAVLKSDLSEQIKNFLLIAESRGQI